MMNTPYTKTSTDPRFRTIAVTALLAWAGLVLACLVVASCQAPPTGLSVGASLPRIELPDLDGKMVTLKTYRGRPMILNFWATWCGPCRDEIPILKKIARSGVDVEVVGISLDEGERELVQNFVSQQDIRYPILLGPTSLLRDLGTNAIPYTVVLDANHVVVKIYRGLISERMLERDLQHLKSGR